MSDENMSNEEIKEYIFDDLLEFLEETGSSNAITAAEIADYIEEPADRVRTCMQEMEREGVLTHFKEGNEDYYRLSDETLEELLAEMEEAGWSPPPDDSDEEYYDEEDDDYKS